MFQGFLQTVLQVGAHIHGCMSTYIINFENRCFHEVNLKCLLIRNEAVGNRMNKRTYRNLTFLCGKSSSEGDCHPKCQLYHMLQQCAFGSHLRNQKLQI